MLQGVFTRRQSTVLQGPRTTEPTETTTTAEELILEESEPPREAAVEPEPERQEELHVDPNAKRDKRLKSENAKSESLGLNPKEARERARAQLQNGYYISTSGGNSTRVLHRLGSCYMVPGIDYPRYAFSGTQMPKQGDLTASANCALAKVQESPTVIQTLRRRHPQAKKASEPLKRPVSRSPASALD